MGTSETGNLQLKRTQFDLVQPFPLINTVNLRIRLQQEGQSWVIGGEGWSVGVAGWTEGRLMGLAGGVPRWQR